MLSALCTVDLFFLKQMLALLRWGTEWLSLKRKWIERSMIVGYVGGLSVNLVLDFHHSHPFHRFDTTIVAVLVSIYLLIGWVMWEQQKMPEARRLQRLVSMDGILGRTFCLFLTICFSAAQLAPPRRWFDLCIPLGFICYTAFVYMISLPEDGERGRKRKLALAKLKEMFGTSWITAPIPQPQ